MRENAKTVLRLFEMHQFVSVQTGINGPKQRPLQRGFDHISPETAADPYLRPAFAASDRAKRLVWNICPRAALPPVAPPLPRLASLSCSDPSAPPWARAATSTPRPKSGRPWNLALRRCQVTAADGADIYNPAPMRFGSHSILSQDAFDCGATHDYDDPRFPLLALRYGASAAPIPGSAPEPPSAPASVYKAQYSASGIGRHPRPGALDASTPESLPSRSRTASVPASGSLTPECTKSPHVTKSLTSGLVGASDNLVKEPF